MGVDSIIIYSYKSICISILLGNRSITIQQVKLIKKIKLLLCKIQKHRDVSVILFPLRKLRSTRITDLVFTSAKRLSSSIPLALHSGHKLLTLQNAAVFAPLMILVPARRTVNGPQFASHPYPAVFALLTRHPGNETTPRAGTATINIKKAYATTPPRNPKTPARARSILGWLPFPFGLRFALPSIEAAPDLT